MLCKRHYIQVTQQVGGDRRSPDGYCLPPPPPVQVSSVFLSACLYAQVGMHTALHSWGKRTMQRLLMSPLCPAVVECLVCAVTCASAPQVHHLVLPEPLDLTEPVQVHAGYKT